MSLFGALNTSVSGLSAQSAAFSNISDNVANSQTVGYKEVDTEFIDYLTDSTAEEKRSRRRGHQTRLYECRPGNDHAKQQSAGIGRLRPGLFRGVRDDRHIVEQRQPDIQ